MLREKYSITPLSEKCVRLSKKANKEVEQQIQLHYYIFKRGPNNFSAWDVITYSMIAHHQRYHMQTKFPAMIWKSNGCMIGHG